MMRKQNPDGAIVDTFTRLGLELDMIWGTLYEIVACGGDNRPAI